jgi:hypothetical protein
MSATEAATSTRVMTSWLIHALADRLVVTTPARPAPGAGSPPASAWVSLMEARL